jgi:hypothetical protein
LGFPNRVTTLHLMQQSQVIPDQHVGRFPVMPISMRLGLAVDLLADLLEQRFACRVLIMFDAYGPRGLHARLSGRPCASRPRGAWRAGRFWTPPPHSPGKACPTVSSDQVSRSAGRNCRWLRPRALARVNHASPLWTLQRLCFGPDVAADLSDRGENRDPGTATMKQAKFY